MLLKRFYVTRTHTVTIFYERQKKISWKAFSICLHYLLFTVKLYTVGFFGDQQHVSYMTEILSEKQHWRIRASVKLTIISKTSKQLVWFLRYLIGSRNVAAFSKIRYPLKSCLFHACQTKFWRFLKLFFLKFAVCCLLSLIFLNIFVWVLIKTHSNPAIGYIFLTWTLYIFHYICSLVVKRTYWRTSR